MNASETSTDCWTNLEYTLGYYMPAIPFVDQTFSVDFGSGRRSDLPDSIQACRINAASSRDEARTVLSYATRNDPVAVPWSEDSKGCDTTIEKGEAYEYWRRLGYGYVCTGSLKEARFLFEKCKLPNVVFIDEEYLKMQVEHLGNYNGIWHDIIDDCAFYESNYTDKNCYYRCLRLCNLIEQYKKLYYEGETTEEMRKNTKNFGTLEFWY